MTAGVEFLSGQLPDVVLQLLTYNTVINIVWLVLGLASIAGAVIVFLKHRHYIAEELRWDKAWMAAYGDAEKTANIHRKAAAGKVSLYFVLMIVFGVLALLGAVTACMALADLLQIWLAPKVWLIQYAAHLVK